MRWCHYDKKKREFIAARQKNGGRNRLIPYTDEEPLKWENPTEKGRALFFSGGKNNFGGRIQEKDELVDL